MSTTSNSAQTITEFRIEYPPIPTSTQRERFMTLWLAFRTLIRRRKTITPGTAPGQWLPFFGITWWRRNP